MREKFGLDFVIVDSALMAQVRRTHGLAANPFRLFPRVIVSMAWLPSVRAQRLLRDVYAEVARPGSGRRFAFDALVVDEAHHVAPASPSALGGGRARLRLAAPHPGLPPQPERLVRAAPMQGILAVGARVRAPQQRQADADQKVGLPDQGRGTGSSSKMQCTP